MKKLIAFLLAFLTCGTIADAVSAKSIKIYLNNYEIAIPAKYGQPFYDENGRVQMPVRYILEKCGYSVLWDNQNHTVTVSGDKAIVVLTAGSNMMKTVHGNITMDTAVKTKENRTYLPLRNVLEELGSSVSWERKDNFDAIQIISSNISASSPQTQVLNARQISDKVSPAVLFVKVFQDKDDFATGSGFFINEQGVAVTNYHVIEATTSAIVELTDGKKYPVERVLSYDKQLDIAVIKVSKTSTDGTVIPKFSYVTVGNSDDIANGDKVYAIGSPEGFKNTISDGIISNKNRSIEDIKQTFIQITAPISSGSSGGVLVNDIGEAIGITNGGWTEGQNINFAIPINCLEKIDIKSDGIPYKDVCVKEFKKRISDNWAAFTDRICDEVEDDSLYNEIECGDTYLSTFAKASDTDYYSFYVPIPVYVTVISGGMGSKKYDTQLDMKTRMDYGMDWNSYVLESFRIIFQASDESKSIKPEFLYDSDDNMLAVIDKVRILPGRYTIAAFQNLKDEQAWADRDYFVYLSLEE